MMTQKGIKLFVDALTSASKLSIVAFSRQLRGKKQQLKQYTLQSVAIVIPLFCSSINGLRVEEISARIAGV